MDTYIFTVFLLLSTFGLSRQIELEIHHLYSKSMKNIISPHTLPQKGSYDYYAMLAHIDGVRRNTYENTKKLKPITFLDGNQTTFNYLSLWLYFVNISLGEPIKSYVLALDTGSDLFWIQCNQYKLGDSFYNPSTSSTSIKIPCHSPRCMTQKYCDYDDTSCGYEVKYIDNTSSSGILFEDTLHLVSDEQPSQRLDARVIIGCGLVQPKNNKITGLIGLGMNGISIPSLLAKTKLIPDSFSMCFSSDQTGRIKFGDKGILGQKETPFRKHPRAYMVDFQVGNYETSAVFDSGATFTYLPDPIYSFIVETFNRYAQLKGLHLISNNIFENCYYWSSYENNTLDFPTIYLTMKGGSIFRVNSPMMPSGFMDGAQLYCLGVFKSNEVNTIGQNFMTGYRITFDRERMTLGWIESNCYNDSGIPILPTSKAPLTYECCTSFLGFVLLFLLL